MTYADIINSCMFNEEEYDDTFSDDSSFLLTFGSDITDEPEPSP